MIQRVYEKARSSNAESVYVATDNEQIAESVLQIDGQVIMTSEQHESGTDRIHEAASSLGLEDDEIVVNVQGDEPLIPVDAINQVAELLSGDARMATLMTAINHPEEIFDPNIVKVVTDDAGRALYFSRAPIPWSRAEFDQGKKAVDDLQGWHRHLGIYSYRMSLLKDFVTWPTAGLERTESLEQLRVLANGESVQIAQSLVDIPPSVDTPEDVSHVLDVLAGEPR